MANKEPQNKIGESFEQNFPNELVPDFIWDNISNTLDRYSGAIEHTEKIKTSFEAGFEEAILPPLLWTDIQASLDSKTTLHSATGSDNKIKTSFETKEEELLPEDFWEKVETQLEIEGVWKRVLKGLNRRTKKAYWQEKGMQLGIAALALLLLRGCDLGAFSKQNPMANESNVITKIKTAREAKTEQNPSNYKQNSSTNSLKKAITLDNFSIINKEAAEKTALQANSARMPRTAIARTVFKNKNGTINTINNNKSIAQNSLVSKARILPKEKIEVAVNDRAKKTTAVADKSDKFIKKIWRETPILTLERQPFIDPRLDTFPRFEIEPIVKYKKHNIRFELGMNVKVGTSLLLGNATSEAMQTTSMIKTEMRATGGIGIVLGCYFTANDAIIFGVYPLSSRQQYFGGYTSEGRYYHKEIKLAYFDFTLAYQRTLFHYNDFGAIPSSMYARLDYGLSYLSKSEEIMNGLATELGTSYRKFHHNVGLKIGNTHRINRFVIDYGIYANIGLSSVQNIDPSGTSVVAYTNLATMGGYLGLRYVL